MDANMPVAPIGSGTDDSIPILMYTVRWTVRKPPWEQSHVSDARTSQAKVKVISQANERVPRDWPEKHAEIEVKRNEAKSEMELVLQRDGNQEVLPGHVHGGKDLSVYTSITTFDILYSCVNITFFRYST